MRQSEERSPPWAPPHPASVPLPPTSLPTDVVESAQNNLSWSLFSLLGFVGFLVAVEVFMLVRGVSVPDSFHVFVAGIGGAAMNNVGDITKSISGLLAQRRVVDTPDAPSQSE